MLRRLYVGLGALLLAVAAVAVVVYFFGVPQSGGPGTEVAAVSAEPSVPGEEAAAADEGAAVADAQAATGQAPAPDPSTPLAIEIPGCVCHSDDPKLVDEHRAYRMNQCAGCHAGGTPTGR